MSDVARVKFTLPLPPSINDQYTRVGQRRVLSKAHRAFKKAVAHRVHCLRVDEVISDAFVEALRDGYVGFFMDFYFETPLRRDLDGGLKITLDAVLEPLGLNDNRVVDIHLVKRMDPLRPRVEVELEAMAEWQFDAEYAYLGEAPPDDNAKKGR